jgi:hypothetical protein
LRVGIEDAGLQIFAGRIVQGIADESDSFEVAGLEQFELDAVLLEVSHEIVKREIDADAANVGGRAWR